MDTSLLAASSVISLYFIIGSYFEEKKLVDEYGEIYRKYKHRVPALMPNPWKYLSPKEAEELLLNYSKQMSNNSISSSSDNRF